MASKKVLVELTDSYNEESEDVGIIPCSPSLPTRMKRKSSSGGFELLYQYNASEFTETSRGGILIQKNQHKTAEMSAYEWKKYFSIKDGVSIIMYADATHSVVRGLDDERTLLLWEGICLQPPVYLNIRLKQSNIGPKYYSEIQEALNKLEKGLLGIGYLLTEMKIILPEVLSLLNSYSLEDPEVGFSRGMEYLAFGIVEIAITHPSVRDRMLADKVRYLTYLMWKLQLRGVYLPSKPSIFSKTKKLEARLEKELPVLMKTITGLNLDTTHLFYKYYLGLFLYGNTHRVLVSRILELLLLEGYDFVTYIIIRILTYMESIILEMPKSKLEQYLHNDLFRGYFMGASAEEALRLLERLVIKRIEVYT